jgi:hypothetical protein
MVLPEPSLKALLNTHMVHVYPFCHGVVARHCSVVHVPCSCWSMPATVHA